jgi:hypothetical protein
MAIHRRSTCMAAVQLSLHGVLIYVSSCCHCSSKTYTGILSGRNSCVVGCERTHTSGHECHQDTLQLSTLEQGCCTLYVKRVKKSASETFGLGACISIYFQEEGGQGGSTW